MKNNISFHGIFYGYGYSRGISGLKASPSFISRILPKGDFRYGLEWSDKISSMYDGFFTGFKNK